MQTASSFPLVNTPITGEIKPACFLPLLCVPSWVSSVHLLKEGVGSVHRVCGI